MSIKKLFVVFTFLLVSLFLVSSASAHNSHHNSHHAHSTVSHHYQVNKHNTHWYYWFKKPACHVHKRARPKLHKAKHWWNWRVLRHLRKHWRGSEHCKDEPVNESPIAEAGTDLTVISGETVTLNASFSTDSDGDIATYSWQQQSGETVVLNGADKAIATFIAPSVSEDTELVFAVTVTDNDGAESTDMVTVTIEALVANQLPIISITAPAIVNALEPIMLDGSASSDPDGSIVTASWQQTAGATSIILSNADTLQASFIVPIVPPAPFSDVLSFELTVVDDAGAMSTESIDIELVGAEEPSITTNGEGTYELDSDPTTIEVIELSVDVVDLDSTDFTYQWSQLSGQVVAISTPTLAQTEIELPEVDTPTTLEFQIVVTDDTGLMASEIITIIVEPAPVVGMSTINGRVIDVTGVPVDGVLLTAIDVNQVIVEVLSGADGSFSLAVDAAAEYVIQLTRDGFADQVFVATAPIEGGVASFDNVVMIERGTSIIVADSGNRAESGADGAQVTFDKDNFVDDSGQPVTGDIELTITPVNIADPANSRAFPGLFAGVPEGSVDPELIISLGTVEYEFTQNGAPINLAAGATADVIIPIYVTAYPDGSPVALGQSIPLWSLDEDTGVWLQEGQGTVVELPESPTGFGFAATVSHFSWWNCDVTFRTARVEVTVLGIQEGTAVINGSTTLAPSNWRPDSVSTTIAIGDTTRPLFIPANQEVCFYADLNYNNGESASTSTKCVTAPAGQIVQLELGSLPEGPLDLVVNPETSDDFASVEVVLGFASTLSVRPATLETGVTYEVIGALPDGVSLNIFGDQASLVGIAQGLGQFDFVIRGTDSDGDTDDISVSFLVFDDSLDINAIFASDVEGFFQTGVPSDSDVVNVTTYAGFEGFYADSGKGVILIVRVDSQEVGVTYSTSGALPNGVLGNVEESACCIDNNLPSYHIRGAADEAGVFTYVVVGVDAEGGRDEVRFNITVLDQMPPPLLISRFFVGGANTQTFDLNDELTGQFFGEVEPGVVDLWEVVLPGDPDADECLQSEIGGVTALPNIASLDGVTGILTVPADFIWSGCIRGSNESGSDVAPVEFGGLFIIDADPEIPQ